jgi:hypothetical protein
MKKILLSLFIFFVTILSAWAQSSPGFLSLTEEDGDPDCYGWQIKATNGSVTDNGDGTCSISTGGGVGYTNLTQFVAQTNWRIFYSDGSGDVKELAFGTDGQVLTSTGTGTAPLFKDATGGALSGLTAGYHTKALTTSTIGNSVVYDDGTNVGIGSTAPQAKLDVEGSVYVGNGNIGVGSSAPGQKIDVLGTVKATYLQTTNLTSTATGVGINSATPSQKLDVVGTVKATNFVGSGSGIDMSSLAWANDWKMAYSNGTGTQELAIGGANTFLMSNGDSAPTWTASDGSGDCGAGTVCLGNHTHSTYATLASPIFTGNVGIGTTSITALGIGSTSQFTVSTIGVVVAANIGVGSATPSQKVDVVGTVKATLFIGDLTGTASATASDSTWTTHNSYPSACAGGSYASAIGDTLTCGTPTGSGTVNSGVGGRLAYYPDTNTLVDDLTAIYSDNTNVGIGTSVPSVKLDVIGTVKATLFNGSGASLTSIPSDGTWTTHDSYPAACSGGQYVTAIGDTLTCGTPSGSGTVNSGVAGYLARYPDTGTTIDDDAVIYSNGTNVGLGSVTPRSKLDVVGDVTATTFVGALTGTASGNLISGGTLTSGYHCRYDGTGIDCDRVEDASGACAANAVCMGGHNHDVVDLTWAADWKMAYSNTSGLVELGLGSANTFLMSNGDSAPTWTASDGSGDCGAGTVCLGNHTHSTYATLASPIFTGNVGIGTTSITALGIGSTSQFTVSTAGAVTGLSLVTTGNVGIGTTAIGQRLIVIGGNVGVGSTAPQSVLDVVGTVTATAIWTTNIKSTASNVGIGTSVPAQRLDVQGSIYANGNIGIGTAIPVSALQIKSTGNVGIGSTVPVQKLEVIGTVKATAFISTNIIEGAANVGIGSSVPTQKLDVTGSAVISTNVGIGTTAVGARLIVYGGNVGIGTTVPGAVLDVVGTASKLRMQSADGTYWNCQPVNTTGVFTCS